MTDEKLLALMMAVDPLTRRIPEGIRAIAQAIEAAERERCANVCEEIDDKCPECAGHNAHDQCVIPQAWQYAAAIRVIKE